MDAHIEVSIKMDSDKKATKMKLFIPNTETVLLRAYQRDMKWWENELFGSLRKHFPRAK